METLTAFAEAEKDPIEKAKFEDLVLIHGDVVPTEGPDQGNVIDHAWIEMACHAFDVADDISNPATKPIEQYHERFKVKVRATYTISEARSLAEKTQMYGPWDPKGRSARSLDPLPTQDSKG